jgi:preprotein translocase subunit SecD
MKKLLLVIVSIILIVLGIKSVFIDDYNRDGVYYKLSIEGKVPLRQRLNAFAIRIQNELDREDIVYDDLKINNNKFTFEFLDEDDELKVKNILNKVTSIFDITKHHHIYSLSFKAKYLKQEESKLLEKTKKVLEKRLESIGLYKTLFDAFLSEKTTVIISDEKFIEINISKFCDKCPDEKVSLIPMFC